MSAHANFDVVRKTKTGLVIRDLGPWDKHKTITNDAEWVVSVLAPKLDGRRLMYIDSEGQLDELIVKHGRFVGFGHVRSAPCRKRS